MDSWRAPYSSHPGEKLIKMGPRGGRAQGSQEQLFRSPAGSAQAPQGAQKATVTWDGRRGCLETGELTSRASMEPCPPAGRYRLEAPGRGPGSSSASLCCVSPGDLTSSLSLSGSTSIQQLGDLEDSYPLRFLIT